MRRDRGFSRFRMLPVPEEDDEQAIRRTLWLAIDAAYKTAIENLARKKAVLEGQVRSDADKLADFTTEEPASVILPVEASSFDLVEWEKLAAQLSGLFREFPDIQSSRVVVGWMQAKIRYADSDGGFASHPRRLWLLEATAATQAADGMPLRDFVSFYAPRSDQAPDLKTLTAAVREMAQRISALRSAPVMESAYAGPVLIEGQAVAELFMTLAGMSAATGRDPVFEDPRFAAFFNSRVMSSP